MRLQKATLAPPPLSDAQNAMLDVLFGYRGFVQFIADQCECVVERYNSPTARFLLEDTPQPSLCVLRCEETGDVHIMHILSIGVLLHEWSALRTEFSRRLAQHFAGVDIAVDPATMAFSITWAVTTLESTMLSRFDRLEELIKALPPIVGGVDYLRAKERFERWQTSDVDK